MSASRDHFATERPNPASERLDELSTADAFDVMNAEDARVAAAVAAAKPEIVRAIELVVRAPVARRPALLRRRGHERAPGRARRGRVPADVPERSVAGAGRDRRRRARADARRRRRRGLARSRRGATSTRAASAPQDVVFGIAAGGTTPFVHGALARARERGAATVFLACVPREQARDEADVSIRVVTGPEVLAGSTRLKAGTATKLVLNTVTTLAMARLGKVHGNLMVDVETRANAKLWQRGIALVARVVGCDRARAEALLQAADGRVKVAVVMGRAGVDAGAARARLERAGGFLRRALEG